MSFAVLSSSSYDKLINSSKDSAYETIFPSISFEACGKCMNKSNEIYSRLIFIDLFGPSNLMISLVANIYIYSLPTLYSGHRIDSPLTATLILSTSPGI